MAKMVKQLDLKYAWLQLMAGQHGPSNPNTRLVLFVLSLHMKKTGADCWPSVQHIARRSSLSERAVREHVKLAVAAGWLSVTARSGIVNVYFPVIPEAAKATIGRKPGVKMKPWLQKANGLGGDHPESGAASSTSDEAPTPAPAAGVLPPAQSEPQTPAPGAPHPCTTVRGPLHQVHPNSLGNYVINNPETGLPQNGVAGGGFVKVKKPPKPESDAEKRKRIVTARSAYPAEVLSDETVSRMTWIPLDDIRRLN